MPELPEVETVRRSLLPLIQGRTITGVSVVYPKIIVGEPELFVTRLIGRRLETIDRRGKYLLFRFDHDLTMISHLRMEGKYFVRDMAVPDNKHVHVVFSFDQGINLQYQDVRKFGRMQLVETGTENQVGGLKTLGPEPFSPEFTAEQLLEALSRHHKALKPVLLDQHAVTGLGNIYVDEVLWLSRINPQLPADQLNLEQAQLLHDQIKFELQLAIDHGGTTIRSYVDAQGQQGQFQFDLHVYGRQGQPCERCGHLIQKIKLDGRGTHFCPHCQPLPSVNEME